jgi:hypothetical protein
MCLYFYPIYQERESRKWGDRKRKGGERERERERERETEREMRMITSV